MLSLCSCQSEESKAESLMEEIRADFEAGRYEKALVGVDSLRHTYPTAVEARKEALRIHQEASLKIAQSKLADIDSRLQRVEAQYDSMAVVVEEHRKALTATPQELQEFNELRAYRDSLKGVFDVECARIKYIHRRQKQL